MAVRVLIAVLWALCCSVTPTVSAAPLPDSLRVEAELVVQGNHRFSVDRVRTVLGAGRVMPLAEWSSRLDSLAALYSAEGYPRLELRAPGADTGQVTRVQVEEGPRLVLGTVRITPDSLARLASLDLLAPGRTLRAGVLEEALAALLEELDSKGQALAAVEIRRAEFFPGEDNTLLLDIELECTRLDMVHPRDIRFTGLTNSLPSTLVKLARLQADAPWSPRRNQQARLRLQRSGWFSRVDGPRLARGPEGHLLLVDVDELPSYRFEGLVGLLPGREGESSRVSFLLALDLENLLGTGRRLNLKAARPDGISQELRFRYREPFVFGLPLGLGGQVEQQVQDSTWLSRSASLEADWELAPGLETGASLAAREILPDSSNGWVRLAMDRSSAWVATGWLEADFRDDALNPSKGWRAGLRAESINRRALTFRGLPARGEDQVFWRQQSDVQVFLRPLPAVTPRMLVLALRVAGGRVSQEDVLLEERFALGGTAGPRGYRDGQFRAGAWGLAQTELRWRLGRASRAWLFWDLARLEPGPTPAFTRQGRGVGLLVPVAQGVLSVEYALGERLALREGLLHLKLSSRF